MSGAMTPGFNYLSSLGGAKGRVLAAGKPIVVRNPDAVRPWQHVSQNDARTARIPCAAAETGNDR